MYGRLLKACARAGKRRAMRRRFLLAGRRDASFLGLCGDLSVSTSFFVLVGISSEGGSCQVCTRRSCSTQRARIARSDWARATCARIAAAAPSMHASQGGPWLVPGVHASQLQRLGSCHVCTHRSCSDWARATCARIAAAALSMHTSQGGSWLVPGVHASELQHPACTHRKVGLGSCQVCTHRSCRTQHARVSVEPSTERVKKNARYMPCSAHY